jgi:hypothetical protein
MSNGGYKPGITEAEFPDDASVFEFRQWLHGHAVVPPSRLGDYYTQQAFGNWIATGQAVIVNAVPYRSPRLSRERYNQAVATQLPSLAAHRNWLMQEVLPEAAAGRRFLLIHRNKWWAVPALWAGPCVLFSNSARAEPNRPTPDREKLDQAQAWLEKHDK